jgi:thiamine kinase-like enzyme
MPDLERCLAALADDVPEIREIMGRISPVRLGGLSNRNYRLDTPRGALVLRVPRPDPGPFVDRNQEIEATRLTSALGISPDLLYGDATGLMLLRWSEARPMSAERLGREPAALARIGQALARLHRDCPRFHQSFDPFRILDRYTQSGRSGWPWSDRLQAALNAARSAAERSSLARVPSHCDLVPENCLDDGSRTYLIDWEYAGMNDPAWDPAYLALEAQLDAANEGLLLASYGNPAVTYGRMQVFKMVAAALNHAWGLGLPRMDAARARPSWLGQRLASAEALARDPRLDSWIAGL